MVLLNLLRVHGPPQLYLWSRRPTLSCLQTKWEARSNYAKGWSEFWSWSQLWLKSLWEWPPIVGVLDGVLQRQTSRELIWESFTHHIWLCLPEWNYTGYSTYWSWCTLGVHQSRGYCRAKKGRMPVHIHLWNAVHVKYGKVAMVMQGNENKA